MPVSLQPIQSRKNAAAHQPTFSQQWLFLHRLRSGGAVKSRFTICQSLVNRPLCRILRLRRLLLFRQSLINRPLCRIPRLRGFVCRGNLLNPYNQRLKNSTFLPAIITIRLFECLQRLSIQLQRLSSKLQRLSLQLQRLSHKLQRLSFKLQRLFYQMPHPVGSLQMLHFIKKTLQCERQMLHQLQQTLYDVITPLQQSFYKYAFRRNHPLEYSGPYVGLRAPLESDDSRHR